jgi:hypothetical protein
MLICGTAVGLQPLFMFQAFYLAPGFFFAPGFYLALGSNTTR